MGKVLVTTPEEYYQAKRRVTNRRFYAARARELRDKGYTWTQVGGQMGVSREWARKLAAGWVSPRDEEPPDTSDMTPLEARLAEFGVADLRSAGDAYLLHVLNVLASSDQLRYDRIVF